MLMDETEGPEQDQQVRAIPEGAGNDPPPTPLPPIRLVTVRTAGGHSWPREQIYEDESRLASCRGGRVSSLG